MDDPKKKFLQNFDWKSFEQFFGGKLPQIPLDHLNHTNWIEKYVQDSLKQAFNQSTETIVSSGKFSSEVFETHKNLILKISIPDKAQAKNIRVLVGSNTVKLESSSGKPIQTIKLGANVVASRCKALYKNGIMQLQLRKQADEGHFHETFIRFED